VILKQEGIVLKTIKYGETSIILKLFSETAGIKSYIVKGIRKINKKGNSANLFQIGTIIQFVTNQKPFQQISQLYEYQISVPLFENHEHIIKSCILNFAIELVYKSIPEEETLEDIYHFLRNFLLSLNQASSNQLTYYPLYFCCKIAELLGYQISERNLIPMQVNTPLNTAATDLLLHIAQCKNINEINNLAFDYHARNQALEWCVHYLGNHTHKFKQLKSLEIIRTILRSD
jgi:DNA repair protein RecO (recombination protein O)